jgi:transcriptional antiterminator Rof (Rho-off)
MEESAFKKDITPYLIFACKRCQQYSYVKTTQKTKKCLRCGHSYHVKDLLKEGEIVSGLSKAVDTVTRKQNELSVPEFRSQGDFVINTSDKIPKKQNLRSLPKENFKKRNETDVKFKALLYNLANLYGKFPRYMIEIMAENNGISSGEIPRLIEIFEKQGILVQLKDDGLYYQISREH